MAQLRDSSRTLSVLVLLCAPGTASAGLEDEIRARGVAAERVVHPFSSGSALISQFAQRVVTGRGGVDAGERIYRALLQLKHSGRIIGDRVNRPKARLPATGTDVLVHALDDRAALPAGCYELTSAFIAAARSIGIDARGMAAPATDFEGQIGHVVATVSAEDGGRPMVFDLQNETMHRSERYLPLSDLEMVAHHYNHLAVARYLRGELRGALTAIDDALALAPMTPSFLNNRSATLLALGEAVNALADSAHAVAGAPAVAVYRLQWGQVERSLGRLENAASAFRSALALSPGYGRARLELGWTYALANQPAEARRQLEVARALSDVADEATVALAALELRAGRDAGPLIASLPAGADRADLELLAGGGTPDGASRVAELWRSLTRKD